MVRKAIGSCFVGHLNQATTESDLFYLFSQIGLIESIRVVKDRNTRESRGYGYVNFVYFIGENPVGEAIKRLNYHELHGRQILVMRANRLRRNLSETGVYVKGLEPEIDDKTLHETFEVFGAVVSARIARTADGYSLGYGSVQFESSESAAEAVHKAQDMLLRRRFVTVEKYKTRKERETDNFTNVFIKQLPSYLDSQQKLEELFAPFGAITSILLPMENGVPKGFGFVNFKHTLSAKEAIEVMHGRLFDGKELYVQKAQTKQERRRELTLRHLERKQARAADAHGRNLYVKHFPRETTDDDLHNLFSRFGTITSAKVMTSNGRSRGFGFVCFSTKKEANNALVGLNGYRISPNVGLYISFAQSFSERRGYLDRVRRIQPHQACYAQEHHLVPVAIQGPSAMSLPPRPFVTNNHMAISYPAMPYPVPPPTPIRPGFRRHPSRHWKDKSRLQQPQSYPTQEQASYLNVSKPKDGVDNDLELMELRTALYPLVFEIDGIQIHAQTITDMLIDMGKDEVQRMLMNRDLLLQRIQEKAETLEQTSVFASD